MFEGIVGRKQQHRRYYRIEKNDPPVVKHDQCGHRHNKKIQMRLILFAQQQIDSEKKYQRAGKAKMICGNAFSGTHHPQADHIGRDLNDGDGGADNKSKKSANDGIQDENGRGNQNGRVVNSYFTLFPETQIRMNTDIKEVSDQ